VVADRRDSPELGHSPEGDVRRGSTLEATLGHLEEQREPAAAHLSEDEMAAGHRHQLEDQRVGNAPRARRPAEDVVVAVKGLLHLDARTSVEVERDHFVDEPVAHRCQKSATTAIASVSVCDRDTVLRVKPALATASATAPFRARLGAPAGSRVTSTSRQLIAPLQPVPSAFSVASLAANRAARCTHGRCWVRQYARSASLNVPASRSSRPSKRARKAATSTRSTPTRTERYSPRTDSAAMPRRAEPIVWTTSRIVGSIRYFSSALGGTMIESPGSTVRMFVKLEIADPSALTMCVSFLSASLAKPPTRLI